MPWDDNDCKNSGFFQCGWKKKKKHNKVLVRFHLFFFIVYVFVKKLGKALNIDSICVYLIRKKGGKFIVL